MFDPGMTYFFFSFVYFIFKMRIDVDSKYRALGCDIKSMSKTDKDWKFIEEYIKKNYASP